MNPGDLYGRYQIIRRIGHGAMGEVYLALDGEVRNQVALKVVYHDADDNEILEAEQVGAELQRQLSGRDKRVVVVNRTGSINGDLFIEMEYIQGEDLSTMISRAAITPGQAAVYAMEICEMLENLHSFSTMIGEKQFTGIVHGDLKPKNIRINLQNEVKVLDFGIAKALSHTRKQTMNVFGSTAYCSPERIETGSMDLHSDLWSVGVLLYQMVSCRLPFEQATKESLERRIRSNEPPEPLAGLCPAPLRNVIFQMLARDPLKRYQTAVEAKEDLNRILRGESVAAVPFDSDATVRTEAPQSSEYTQRTAVPAASVVEVPSGTLWPGWRRAKFAMMAVVACLVIAWLVIQFTSLSDAGKLRADLDAERIANPDDAWQRFQKLNGRAVFSPLLWSARNATERKLVRNAVEAGARGVVAGDGIGPARQRYQGQVEVVRGALGADQRNRAESAERDRRSGGAISGGRESDERFSRSVSGAGAVVCVQLERCGESRAGGGRCRAARLQTRQARDGTTRRRLQADGRPVVE